MAVEGNGSGWCAADGDILLSAGWAAGYKAEESRYIVYLGVVVVRRCVGSEGEGGRY